MESIKIPVVQESMKTLEELRNERVQRHASILPMQAYDPKPRVKSFDELPAVKRARQQVDLPIIEPKFLADKSPEFRDAVRMFTSQQQRQIMGGIEREQEYFCREATATQSHIAIIRCSVMSALAIAIRDVFDRTMEEVDQAS